VVEVEVEVDTGHGEASGARADEEVVAAAVVAAEGRVGRRT